MDMGKLFLILIIIACTNLLYLSPSIARNLGVQAARSSDWIILNLLGFVLYFLAILVLGFWFAIFYLSSISGLFFPGIDTNYLMVALFIILGFVEINFVWAYWNELRYIRKMKREIDRLSL